MSQENLMSPETVNTVKYEILDLAGKRTFEESQKLFDNVASVQNHAQRNGEGRIHNAETIADIDVKQGKGEIRHFNEGGIEYHKLETGKIICISDVHGDFDSLSKALAVFISRKEAGEDVYFNFSGDFSSSDFGGNRIESIEALFAAKEKFPNEVFIEAGNADRAHVPLFAGLGSEIIKKYLGEDVYRKFEEKALAAKEEYYKEVQAKNPDDPKAIDKIKPFIEAFGKEIFLGALFLKEARAAGLKPMDAKDFSPEFIYDKFKNEIFKLGTGSSAVLRKHLGRNLVATTQEYKLKSEIEVEKDMIKDAFEHYLRISKAINNSAVVNIINTQNGNMIFSHTWPAKFRNLNELVYDPINQRKAAWHNFDPELSGTKELVKDDHYAVGPDILAEWFEKNKVALGAFGHHHNNRINPLPFGIRIEVITNSKRAGKSAGELKEAAYAEINIEHLGELTKGIYNNAVNFIPLNN
jgi:hypothetical protein